MNEIWNVNSSEFAEEMIMKKAFDDIDFNAILEVYAEEKALTKARKKLEKHLKLL